MLTVYGYPQSRSSRITWALEESGLPWQWQFVDLKAGAGQQIAFQQLNPGGKVPVLQQDNWCLTESLAICSYIGDLVPEKNLVPQTNRQQRAKYEAWGCFVIAELEQPLWSLGKHRLGYYPERLQQHQQTAIEVALWEFNKALTVLEQQLNGSDYAVGDQFTFADLLIAHTLQWAVLFQVPLTSDYLNDYRKRHWQRPALQRALAREKTKE